MNHKKVAAFAVSLLMLAAVTGCGKDEISESSGDAPVSVVSDTVSSENTDEDDEVSDSSESDESESESSEVSAETTAARSGENPKAETTVTKAVVRISGANKDGSGGSAGQGNNSGNYGGGNTAKVTTTSRKTQRPSLATTVSGTRKPSVTTVPAATEAPENTYSAEITFDETVSVSGVNAVADGSVVRITAGGEYLVRGSSSNGQIYINTETEEKVELTLDGVDISHSDGPAIFVDEAKKCVIKLAKDSVNYLSDSGKNKTEDGVIFSNDTLRIKGSGYLEINAGNAHGICSDDDVIIENGNFLINSQKSGIIANDDITVNGGEMTIFGGTNGLKSKGTVHINGGTALISGGSKEEKSSVYAAGGLFYTGGYVYAAGNQVTPPSETPNPYIVVSWVNGVAEENTIGFVLGGTEFASLTPRNSFRCALMLAPEIQIGDSFVPYLNGEALKEFAVEEGQNLFIIE